MKQKQRVLLIFGVLATLIGLFQTTASLPAEATHSYKEPFKDFFDYEWWLPGSEYSGMGRQYGKWTVIEMFPNNPHDFRILSDNAISGTCSAVLDINGNLQNPLCETWVDLFTSPDPDHLTYPDIYLNPAYMRFRFRIDTWNATNSYWRVSLGELSGNENSALVTQVIIALEGYAPPHLWMLYKTGSSASDWENPQNKHQLISNTTVSLGVIHTLELYKYSHADEGEIKVWLDGTEVADLSTNNLDLSYPGGVRSIRIGSSEYYSKLSPGSWATISFDDLVVRDQYVGEDSFPTTLYDLTLDSSPQGKTVRVGNLIVGTTPVTIKVPEGTIPKIGIEPLNFDHWEITPEFDNFSYYSETWPTLSPPLAATVTRAEADHGPGPRPTPAIYRDTRITAIYLSGAQHHLNIASKPSSIPFTVDELDYLTPWNGSLSEGSHTVSMPPDFTIGDKMYKFKNWEDSSTNQIRVLNLLEDDSITAFYEETNIQETNIQEFHLPILLIGLIGLITATAIIVFTRLRTK
ncbi:MAG: PEGA domain-containing protein [Candidatus Bathyarchaeota archaeon]|nr:MAG: PEGA domain-containing protein [Candidatus Bathyarchaeota archaeon]